MRLGRCLLDLACKGFEACIVGIKFCHVIGDVYLVVLVGELTIVMQVPESNLLFSKLKERHTRKILQRVERACVIPTGSKIKLRTSDIEIANLMHVHQLFGSSHQAGVEGGKIKLTNLMLVQGFKGNIPDVRCFHRRTPTSRSVLMITSVSIVLTTMIP